MTPRSFTVKDMKSMKVRAESSSIPASFSSWCSPESEIHATPLRILAGSLNSP